MLTCTRVLERGTYDKGTRGNVPGQGGAGSTGAGNAVLPCRAELNDTGQGNGQWSPWDCLGVEWSIVPRVTRAEPGTGGMVDSTGRAVGQNYGQGMNGVPGAGNGQGTL